MLTGILFGGYTINEIYLTNIKQQNAQQYLEDIYTSSNQVTIDETGIANQSNLINLDRLLKDTPVFETFREMVLPENSNLSDKLMPSVFGYLEIPSINLQQYVVTGTNDESFVVNDPILVFGYSTWTQSTPNLLHKMAYQEFWMPVSVND